MATAEYDKNNTTRINLKLNNKTDADIIEKLDMVENVQGYIKAVIRNEMEGEKDMKKFEKITEELYGARFAGYKIDLDADREMDEQLIRVLKAERGENFVDNKLDALYDFDGDLYRDENGEYYAVVMVYHNDKYVPICWQKLAPAKYHIKEEFIDLWGDEATSETVIEGKDLADYARNWDKSISEIIDQLELIR